MSEEIIILAPIRELGSLMDELLKLRCGVRGYNDYRSVMLALRAFPPFGVCVCLGALGCEDEKVAELKEACVMNGVARIIVGKNDVTGDNFRKMALYLAGVKDDYPVSWRA